MANLTLNTKVYYEVIKQPEQPTGVQTRYVYQAENRKMSGVAYSFEEMVGSVRCTEGFSRGELELVQVESLVPVSKRQRVSWAENRGDGNTSRDKWEYPAFNPGKLESLFFNHKLQDIPLSLTVGLACKLMNVNIGRLLKELGFSKNYLSNTLTGAHGPDENFRKVLTERLGIDPWRYAPFELPKVIRRDVIADTIIEKVH
jgi:hypothetical protein